MAEGRLEAAWGQTSEVVAMAYNMHRQSLPYRPPSFFNPYDDSPTVSHKEEPLPVTSDEAFQIMRTTMVG